MASLSDYLTWRGDITFDQVPLTTVDALLLSQLSYLDLRKIIGEMERKQECTLSQAAEQYWKLHTEEELENYVSFALRTAGVLLREMAATKRFGDLLLRNYVRRIDVDVQEQFAALEIVLGKKESFVSFSGTDDHLVGWKEDFNMCFLSPIPSQTDALAYLQEVLQGSTRKVYVGGHSKGGNLSVYASVKCKRTLRKHILRVYNFDGPGFEKPFMESERYQEMKELIETWVPESSIVGMILEPDEAYQVVKSTQSGFMQHDATSWEVLGSEFISVPEVKKSSKRMAVGLKEWMSGLRKDELEFFFDKMYEVLESTEAKTLADLNKDRWKSITTIVRSYSNMEKKAKDMMLAFVKAIVTANVKPERPSKGQGKPELPKKSVDNKK